MSGKGSKWRITDFKNFFSSEYWATPKTESTDSICTKEIKKLKNGKIRITYK